MRIKLDENLPARLAELLKRPTLARNRSATDLVRKLGCDSHIGG